MKGDRVEIVIDSGEGTQTYEVAATRAGRRVDITNRRGVVEVSEPGKVTVFFATGRRVLAQAKEAPVGGLTRPKPFDHSNAAGGKRVGES